MGDKSAARSVGPTTPFIRFEKPAIEQSIDERFESQVRRNAERRAVRTRTEDVSYETLNRRANRIAHLLLDFLGPGREPVGLILEQGVAQIAALIGVVKSGKFYLPIDPTDPDGRIVDMLEDAQSRIILTDARNLARVHALATDKIVVINVDEVATGGSVENPGRAAQPDDFAYLFYTSGSTGKPKGVADTHRNVLHNIMRYTNSLHLSAEDRLTLLQSCSFSGSVSSLFGALLNGAAVFPFDLRSEGFKQVAERLLQERVTIYHSVPSLFRLVAAESTLFPDVRLIRLEGDQASSKDVDIYHERFADDCILVNGLGATECGLVRQLFIDKRTRLESGVLPVGYPVDDMEVVLLGDAEGESAGDEVETGAVGEIAVRSRYLSPGYWRRADLDSRAFLNNASSPEERTYRTGDLGRMRSDGCLEYLGRRDSQRKVRGHRIDVTEVETALLRLDNVHEAVVQVRDDGSDDPRLVAYLVAVQGPSLTVSQLRRDLSEKLADHMIPSAFVFLDRLPLTRNGKVDRRALPAPARTRPEIDSKFRAPSTALESRLVAIWSEVLDLERLGADDNFFDLGGDSIGAAKVTNRLRQELGVDLNLTIVFENPTISELAKRLGADSGAR